MVGDLASYLLHVSLTHRGVGKDCGRGQEGMGIISLKKAVDTHHPLWVPLNSNKVRKN